jgi:hypothetical protein
MDDSQYLIKASVAHWKARMSRSHNLLKTFFLRIVNVMDLG